MNLESSFVFELLKKVNIPVAYSFFKKTTALPNIIYKENGLETVKADNRVYHKEKKYTIELYCEEKDFELEEKLETIFDNHDIVYDKSEEIRLEKEGIYIIYYYI